jgi:non-specific serine/threonine protein kinase
MGVVSNDSIADDVGVPSYLTRFVGRTGELRELVGLILAGRRLITICGVGGIGKTRLAIELARRCASRFPDGTSFVALTSVTHRDDLGRTMAGALLPNLRIGRDPIKSVTDQIAGRPLLLLLDNCEQVASACGDAAVRLLARCPALVVIATSRIPLAAADEQVYAVPPLSHSVGNTTGDALDLFLDRAALGAPGWSVSPDTKAAIADICVRLDGLPLAIELAASWIRVLSPQDLLSEISTQPPGLSALGQPVAARHRSMQAVLASTWRWLAPTERDGLAALSVFSGTFGRDAAEDVAGASLASLATLCERSLLRRVPDHAGLSRYHVHELIRAFGRERLQEAGRLAAVEQRHYDHFARMVDAAVTAWDTTEETAVLQRMRIDHDNIESALERAIARGATTDALRLVGGLFAYWIYSLPLEDRRPVIERTLSLPSDETADPAIRARALNVAGYAWITIDRDKSIGLFAEGLGEYRRAVDPIGEAWTLRGLGYAHLIWGEVAVADRLARESLAMCRAANDPAGVAWSLHDLGECAFARGELSEAKTALVGGIAVFCELGVGFAEYRSRIMLADVHRLQRDWPAALAEYRRVLAVERTTGFSTRAGELLEGVAAVAAAIGRPDLAARLFGALASWYHQFGRRHFRYRNDDYEQSYRTARRQLSGPEWAREHEAGERMTAEQATLEVEGVILELIDIAEASGGSNLTRREREVLRLVADGLTNADIASRLVVSPRTVHAHLRSVYSKLGVSTRTAAVAKAHELSIT